MDFCSKIKKAMADCGALSDFAGRVLDTGLLLMAFCYLLAALSLLLLPYSPSALITLGIYEAGIKTAPACFAASVCAGLICDLAIKNDLKNK